ncbi:MAG: XRE family transcriptional regulator [Gammaproteobacteria bacterium]|nr:XRE family transcriptional regulator [Gammaproteobacteria bacterium]
MDLKNSVVDNRIGARIRAIRQRQSLSQDELAQSLGLNARQILSAIETGARSIKVQELLLIAEQLGVPIEYFTDPFRIDGEVRFSWRQKNVSTEILVKYESKASEWIGAYRTLAPKVGVNPPLIRPSLSLTKQSRYEDAMDAGERFVRDFKLGDVPARRLVEVMEDDLNILVLMVNAEEGISGAACRLPEMDTVLISRNDIVGRRNFGIAHELFHILTFEAMPPSHVESSDERGGDRVEHLANNFAATVLIPASIINKFGPWRELDQDSLVEKLNRIASKLEVTSTALMWRLVSLGSLPESLAQSIPESSLRNNGGKVSDAENPPLFSKRFVEVLAGALNQGHLSIRRAATLVGVPLEALPEIMDAHGVEFTLEA